MDLGILSPHQTALGLFGMLASVVLLIGFAYRGWSVLLLAPCAAILAAVVAGEPALAHWTQTFMTGAARFFARFFPLFLLGALFGKLMEDSGSVKAIASFIADRLGPHRAILAVVISAAIVTYGGVSLFVAFFVITPMATTLFETANIPRRLMPASIALGTSTFTMSALPGTPAIQNAIPMSFFGTSPFAAPGLSLLASLIMVCFGLWWLSRQQTKAHSTNGDFDRSSASSDARLPTATPLPNSSFLRERATVSQAFDPAEIEHGHISNHLPSFGVALTPLVLVVCTNFILSVIVLPRLDTSYLGLARWASTSIAEVGGVWGVCVALAIGNVALILLNWRRLPALRESIAAGANASALPVLSVSSLVGYGAVIAALPAFAIVREWMLGVSGGPLVSLSIATSFVAALTGSASGGLIITLDALGRTYLELGTQHGIDPALLHRVAAIASGTLNCMPHNGAVVTLLAVCQTSHRESYRDVVIVSNCGALVALIVVIGLGSLLGSF